MKSFWNMKICASSSTSLSIAFVSADSYASRTNADRSAPENPSQLSLCAIAFSWISLSSGSFDVTVYRIENLSSYVGRGTYKSLSNRPGLSIAGSMISGLFVAAITKTPLRSSRPSISVRSWFTTLSEELLPSDPLLGTSESSSSKKITQGAEDLALLNS